MSDPFANSHRFKAAKEAEAARETEHKARIDRATAKGEAIAKRAAEERAKS